MTTEQLNLLFGVAVVAALAVIAVSALIAALALVRAARDARRVAASAHDLLDAAGRELPATLSDLRVASAELARLSGEVQPRIERIDGLLDEAAASAASLRATIEAAEEVVRGPAAAVDRARRTVTAAGQGLARGADRLRRRAERRRTRPQ